MVFIVLTKTYYKPKEADQVIKLSKESYPIFKKQQGLQMIKMHKSHDNSHIMTYFIWDNKQSHENCMASPDFAEMNKTWAELMQSGAIKFELNTYDLFLELL
jgi:quinol monooxygenase YgiN